MTVDTRMRAAAAGRPLRQTASKYAKLRFRTAEVFLDWITARGTRPADVTQADIDAFFTTRKVHEKQAIRSFLTWATETGRIPAADVPVVRFAKGTAITQEQRIALVRRFALGDDLPLHMRAAACLLLLYAQPLSRIVRLTTSDVTRGDDGQVFLQFGTPPAPVPEPFSAMLEELAAAGAGQDCLFPGRNPSQPRNYRAFYLALRKAGLPMRDTRTSALRDLVIRAPAPVVADALGFHQTTTHRQHTAAGGTWSRYAATRSREKAPAHATTSPNGSQ